MDQNQQSVYLRKSLSSQAISCMLSHMVIMWDNKGILSTIALKEVELNGVLALKLEVCS